MQDSNSIINHPLVRFFEEAPFGLILLDQKDCFIWANRVFEELTGLGQAELEGISFKTLKSSEPKGIQSQNKSLDRKGNAKKVLLQQKNGISKEFCLSFTDMKKYGEEYAGKLGYLQEVENTASLTNVQGLDSLHRLILRKIDKGVVLLDHKNRMGYINNAAAELLGYECSKLFCQPVDRLASDKKRSALMRIINTARDTTGMDVGFSLRHESGTTLETVLSLHPFRADEISPPWLLIFIETESTDVKIVREEEHGVTSLHKLYQDLENFIGLNEKDTAPDSTINLAPYKLTNREKEILFLLLERNKNTQIAQKLSLAEVTIRKHTTKIYRKFQVQSRGQLRALLHGKKLI